MKEIFIEYNNRVVSCFVGDYNVQKNPPITLTMNLNKTIQSSHPISFRHSHLHYPPLSLKWFLLGRFSKTPLYYILLYHMHATWHICIVLLSDNYVNIWWKVTDMKNNSHPSVPTSLSHQIFSSSPCCQ